MFSWNRNYSHGNAPVFAGSRQVPPALFVWAIASVASILLSPTLAIALDGEVRPESEEEKALRNAQATAAVGVLVGKTSTHYDEYGFKGVRLGQSFAEVKKTHTLNMFPIYFRQRSGLARQ